MNIPRPLAALGAAGAIALAAPAGLAHADTVQPRATGVFTYFDDATGQQTLIDPPDSTCLPIDGQGYAGPVSNLTGNLAIVFLLPGCIGPSFAVLPGQTTYTPLPEFASVAFPAN
jgi:hypothetical protein